jgi:hypothetical protein
MSGNLNWIFYYPYPDSPYDVLVQTANPYPEHIAHLWTLAKSDRPILAEHIGRADCKFYIVRSSFLYIMGGFSYIYSSRLTCLSIRPPPCSLAAEIGFCGTAMMAKEPTAANWSPESSLMRRLLTVYISLLSPKSVRSSL